MQDHHASSFPNTKHGPEWNPCASPEGEALSADCAKQSAHVMKQVKKLRATASLIKGSFSLVQASQRRNSSSLLSHARCFAPLRMTPVFCRGDTSGARQLYR